MLFAPRPGELERFAKGCARQHPERPFEWHLAMWHDQLEVSLFARVVFRTVMWLDRHMSPASRKYT